MNSLKIIYIKYSKLIRSGESARIFSKATQKIIRIDFEKNLLRNFIFFKDFQGN